MHSRLRFDLSPQRFAHRRPLERYACCYGPNLVEAPQKLLQQCAQTSMGALPASAAVPRSLATCNLYGASLQLNDRPSVAPYYAEQFLRYAR